MAEEARIAEENPQLVDSGNTEDSLTNGVTPADSDHKFQRAIAAWRSKPSPSSRAIAALTREPQALV